MSYIQKIVFLIPALIVVVSCSTRKDTFVNRNFHTLTTKYNILFNGKEAFKAGVKEIKEGYKDDYWKRLPIEPITFEEDKLIVESLGFNDFHRGDQEEEEKQLSNFEKAEEKAVKAIQKHAMNINGRERNRQIDDAYLLLGKSRYYSQRFVPAIEAFNYVIANYPYANLINETKIWRAKANIRIDNEELAIESLKLLTTIEEGLEEALPDKIREQAHTALAMAYIKNDSLQKVKKHLLEATRTLENREQSARNLFILGQIYSEEGKKDSAFFLFDKLVNLKKAPYKYKIHAQIELVKNLDKDSLSSAYLKKMQKTIKNIDNRPYLDKLYYQMGVLYEKKDSLKLAINHYNNSLRAKFGDNQQKTRAYERLGNLYFKGSEYQLASSYYDSVLSVAEDKTELRIRRVKRKHKNLASLIKYENSVAVNDSILRIASLPKAEQESFFKEYIQKLKKIDQEREQQQLNAIASGASLGGDFLSSINKGKWYFYNTQSLRFGKSEFEKIWGNRALEDNWRWSYKIFSKLNKEDTASVYTANSKYDLKYYLETIPSDAKQIDSLKTTRNQALYELGIIYKEQFKNVPLAIRNMERVAILNYDKKLALPIHWHLYQIYQQKGDAVKASKHKKIIIDEFPETRFAQIIQNPEKEIKEENSVDNMRELYKQMYYSYKEGKYEEALQEIDKLLPDIQNSKLIAKFELLKAYAIGKHKDRLSYKKAMEFVAVSYPNTEEGQKAKEIVERLSK